MELSRTQADVIGLLSTNDALHISELSARLQLDQAPVTAACGGLQEAGLASIDERTFDELSLGKEGLPHADAPLPERLIVAALRTLGGRCKLTELPAHCPLSAAQIGQTLRWLSQRGWASKQGDDLVLGEVSDAPQPDERLLKALAGGRVARRDALEREHADAGAWVAAGIELLAKRKGFLVVKERSERLVTLTPAGRELAARGVTGKRRVTQLTPELLADGAWREVDLAPYDVTLAAKKLLAGKEHAFQRTLDKVRRVFLELGFTEIVSPWVESSFWDFDALFQPQDHPARDMQDTFYVARPDRCRLPDAALVDRVRRTHEDGGDTGSTGWRYRWAPELAHKPVLRTHTTAATIRALAVHAARRVSSGEFRVSSPNAGSASAANPQLDTRNSQLETHPSASASAPGKYFVIGPVFRRETVDYKHLPVFHQVDGIIVDPRASFAALLGTLSAFYAKMGFPKVRFRPSFFPYTEPSAEVFLWLEGRGEWVEMGGSGIFRPEVTRPLGISDRVLAWGLGLERLAMMIHGLKSIGELYFATMPWLREAPLSRA